MWRKCYYQRYYNHDNELSNLFSTD